MSSALETKLNEQAERIGAGRGGDVRTRYISVDSGFMFLYGTSNAPSSAVQLHPTWDFSRSCPGGGGRKRGHYNYRAVTVSVFGFRLQQGASDWSIYMPIRFTLTTSTNQQPVTTACIYPEWTVTSWPCVTSDVNHFGQIRVSLQTELNNQEICGFKNISLFSLRSNTVVAPYRTPTTAVRKQTLRDRSRFAGT